MTWVSQKLLGVGIIVALLSSVLTLGLFTQTAHADAIDGADGIGIWTERWLRYRAVASCFSAEQLGTYTESEIDSGKWFRGLRGEKTTYIGYLNTTGVDGQVGCSDGGFLTNSLDIIGFQSNQHAFCAVQPSASRGSVDSGTASNYDKCLSGPGDFKMDTSLDAQYKQFKDGKAKYVPDSKRFPYDPTGPIQYHVGKQSLITFCGGTRADPYDDSMKSEVEGDENKVVVNEVDLGTGEILPYVYNIDDDEDDKQSNIWAQKGGSDMAKTCAELAQMTWTHDEAFSGFVKAYNDKYPDDAGSGLSEDENAQQDQVCSAGMLGWILCPLSEAMVSALEGIADLLESFLVFQPLLSSDQGKAIQAIWQSLLVIANLGLVAAVLIVVFSQATSVGLSSYGIKKLLPRIFAAAILMNLSFYICAIAVDMSNILGVSIKGIIDAGQAQISPIGAANVGLQPGAAAGDWLKASAAGLFIAAIALATGAIFLLLPILATAVVAALTALLILAARQVLITLLIIVAPLAILAWILPNTEDWFTKWRKLFTILLLMFPLIMLIFHGSILMSSVILTTLGNGSTSGPGDDVNSFTIKLLAFMVLFVPLFSLPFLMKTVGGVLERFGAITNNRSKGLVDRSRKKADELGGRTAYQRGRELRKRAANEHSASKFTKRVGKRGWGRTAIMARGIGGNAGLLPLTKNTSVGAQRRFVSQAAQAAEAKAFAERVAAIQTSYERAGDRGADVSVGGYLAQQYQQAVASGNHEQAVAAINRMTGMGAGGRNRLAQVLRDTEVSDGDMRDTVMKAVVQDNYGSLVGSRGDTAKGRFGADGRWNTANAEGRLPNPMAGLGTPEIATQDDRTLYQNFADIPQTEAQAIVADANVWATVKNARSRAILQLRANGGVLPQNGFIDPNDQALGRWEDLAQ